MASEDLMGRGCQSDDLFLCILSGRLWDMKHLRPAGNKYSFFELPGRNDGE
ncbi:hypothetical protein PAXINDRAFT_15938 [Paxillus involutus ATCC 200175]|uniref:Uncharacterized protein n=1 Tax=Paxillus involutus ATCC 200175 TaxID=664439 RepID=A0A0C9TKD6_PAXIN|nr:hypothetical protein PAXINDRAFT_15938 [Paxillus involutus ATCC 200175]